MTENNDETDNEEIICDCYVCGKDVIGYTPQMCCNGLDCGCMGMPIEPPLCSEECAKKLYG